MLNLNNFKIDEIEELRDELEFKCYFQNKNIHLTREEIIKLKEHFNSTPNDVNKLTYKQLSKIAGGGKGTRSLRKAGQNLHFKILKAGVVADRTEMPSKLDKIHDQMTHSESMHRDCEEIQHTQTPSEVDSVLSLEATVTGVVAGKPEIPSQSSSVSDQMPLLIEPKFSAHGKVQHTQDQLLIPLEKRSKINENSGETAIKEVGAEKSTGVSQHGQPENPLNQHENPRGDLIQGKGTELHERLADFEHLNNPTSKVSVSQMERADQSNNTLKRPREDASSHEQPESSLHQHENPRSDLTQGKGTELHERLADFEHPNNPTSKVSVSQMEMANQSKTPLKRPREDASSLGQPENPLNQHENPRGEFTQGKGIEPHDRPAVFEHLHKAQERKEQSETSKGSKRDLHKITSQQSKGADLSSPSLKREDEDAKEGLFPSKLQRVEDKNFQQTFRETYEEHKELTAAAEVPMPDQAKYNTELLKGDASEESVFHSQEKKRITIEGESCEILENDGGGHCGYYAVDRALQHNRSNSREILTNTIIANLEDHDDVLDLAWRWISGQIIDAMAAVTTNCGQAIEEFEKFLIPEYKIIDWGRKTEEDNSKFVIKLEDGQSLDLSKTNLDALSKENKVAVAKVFLTALRESTAWNETNPDIAGSGTSLFDVIAKITGHDFYVLNTQEGRFGLRHGQILHRFSHNGRFEDQQPIIILQSENHYVTLEYNDSFIKNVLPTLNKNYKERMEQAKTTSAEEIEQARAESWVNQVVNSLNVPDELTAKATQEEIDLLYTTYGEGVPTKGVKLTFKQGVIQNLIFELGCVTTSPEGVKTYNAESIKKAKHILQTVFTDETFISEIDQKRTIQLGDETFPANSFRNVMLNFLRLTEDSRYSEILSQINKPPHVEKEKCAMVDSSDTSSDSSYNLEEGAKNCTEVKDLVSSSSLPILEAVEQTINEEKIVEELKPYGITEGKDRKYYRYKRELASLEYNETEKLYIAKYKDDKIDIILTENLKFSDNKEFANILTEIYKKSTNKENIISISLNRGMYFVHNVDDKVIWGYFLNVRLDGKNVIRSRYFNSNGQDLFFSDLQGRVLLITQKGIEYISSLLSNKKITIGNVTFTKTFVGKDGRYVFSYLNGDGHNVYFASNGSYLFVSNSQRQVLRITQKGIEYISSLLSDKNVGEAITIGDVTFIKIDNRNSFIFSYLSENGDTVYYTLYKGKPINLFEARDGKLTSIKYPNVLTAKALKCLFDLEEIKPVIKSIEFEQQELYGLPSDPMTDSSEPMGWPLDLTIGNSEPMGLQLDLMLFNTPPGTYNHKISDGNFILYYDGDKNYLFTRRAADDQIVSFNNEDNAIVTYLKDKPVGTKFNIDGLEFVREEETITYTYYTGNSVKKMYISFDGKTLLEEQEMGNEKPKILWINQESAKDIIKLFGFNDQFYSTVNDQTGMYEIYKISDELGNRNIYFNSSREHLFTLDKDGKVLETTDKGKDFVNSLLKDTQIGEITQIGKTIFLKINNEEFIHGCSDNQGNVSYSDLKNNALFAISSRGSIVDESLTDAGAHFIGNLLEHAGYSVTFPDGKTTTIGINAITQYVDENNIICYEDSNHQFLFATKANGTVIKEPVYTSVGPNRCVEFLNNFLTDAGLDFLFKTLLMTNEDEDASASILSHILAFIKKDLSNARGTTLDHLEEISNTIIGRIKVLLNQLHPCTEDICTTLENIGEILEEYTIKNLVDRKKDLYDLIDENNSKVLKKCIDTTLSKLERYLTHLNCYISIDYGRIYMFGNDFIIRQLPHTKSNTIDTGIIFSYFNSAGKEVFTNSKKEFQFTVEYEGRESYITFNPHAAKYIGSLFYDKVSDYHIIREKFFIGGIEFEKVAINPWDQSLIFRFKNSKVGYEYWSSNGDFLFDGYHSGDPLNISEKGKQYIHSLGLEGFGISPDIRKIEMKGINKIAIYEGNLSSSVTEKGTVWRPVGWNCIEQTEELEKVLSFSDSTGKVAYFNLERQHLFTANEYGTPLIWNPDFIKRINSLLTPGYSIKIGKTTITKDNIEPIGNIISISDSTDRVTYFNSEGKYLFIADKDGSALRWNLDSITCMCSSLTPGSSIKIGKTTISKENIEKIGNIISISGGTGRVLHLNSNSEKQYLFTADKYGSALHWNPDFIKRINSLLTPGSSIKIGKTTISKKNIEKIGKENIEKIGDVIQLSSMTGKITYLDSKGQYLFTADEDGSALLWDLDSIKRINSLLIYGSSIKIGKTMITMEENEITGNVIKFSSEKGQDIYCNLEGSHLITIWTTAKNGPITYLNKEGLLKIILYSKKKNSGEFITISENIDVAYFTYLDNGTESTRLIIALKNEEDGSIEFYNSGANYMHTVKKDSDGNFYVSEKNDIVFFNLINYLLKDKEDDTSITIGAKFTKIRKVQDGAIFKYLGLVNGLKDPKLIAAQSAGNLYYETSQEIEPLISLRDFLRYHEVFFIGNVKFSLIYKNPRWTTIIIFIKRKDDEIKFYETSSQRIRFLGTFNNGKFTPNLKINDNPAIGANGWLKIEDGRPIVEIEGKKFIIERNEDEKSPDCREESTESKK